MPVINVHNLIEERVEALRKTHGDSGIPRAELDLSGGIDSAVMACLLVEALGPDNVTLVHTCMSTSGTQTQRAEALAKGLGCKLAVGDFTQIYEEIVGKIVNTLADAGYSRGEIKARVEADPTILGSIRSTLRAPLGRAYNRLTGGGLRHGTGNEDEDRWLRFYQKGGDGEVDSNPIAFLSKGETYQLAWGLGQEMGTEVQAALRPIIEALPSPDLWGVGDDHSDEAELKKWLGVPFTYSRINPDTGEYRYVGTIERVSRLMDCRAGLVIGSATVAEQVFSESEDYFRQSLRDCVWVARNFHIFPDDQFTDNEVIAFLKAARKAERVTRHKLNPNIPTYGTRPRLLMNDILTNTLPVNNS